MSRGRVGISHMLGGRVVISISLGGNLVICRLKNET
jgi:hypothetical protein